MIDTTRNVFNFAPNLDLRIRFSKLSQLRMTYRGRSSQPSICLLYTSLGQHHRIRFQCQCTHVLGSCRSIKVSRDVLALEYDVGNLQHVLTRTDFGKSEITFGRSGRTRCLNTVWQQKQLHGS